MGIGPVRHTSSILIGIRGLGRCLARSHSWSRTVGGVNDTVDARSGDYRLWKGTMKGSKMVAVCKRVESNWIFELQ